MILRILYPILGRLNRRYLRTGKKPALFSPLYRLIAMLEGLALVALLSGCVTVNGKRELAPGAEAGLLKAFAMACPLEAAIPVIGPDIVGACPGEDAGLKAALDKVTAPAGAAVSVDAGTKPVALLRMGTTGLVHCGWANPTIAPALQRALLAAPIADAGADR